MTKKQLNAIKRITANTWALWDDADKYAGYYDDDEGRHCVTNGHMGVRWIGDVGNVPAAPEFDHYDFGNMLDYPREWYKNVYELPSLTELKRARKKIVEESGFDKVKFCPPKPAPCLNLEYLITMLEVMPKNVRVKWEADNKPVYFSDVDNNGNYTIEGIVMPVRDNEHSVVKYGRFDWCHVSDC